MDETNQEEIKIDVPNENTGVLLGKRDSDFIAGTLNYEVRNESGDWRNYLPVEEKQYSQNTDTMACVSFSLNNSCEIQYKHQTGNEINFSDRWLAKMSGTTPQGNWQYKVADTVRKEGLVLESDYPAPVNFTWESYYSEIPDNIKATAQKYETAYEWISPLKSELIKHLKHAPLQIVITKDYPNHAVCLVAIEGDTAFYFDTYSPYLKQLPISKIYNAFKFIINFPMTNSQIVKNGSEYGVYDPATSEDGLITLMRNRGIAVPLTADGKLDWTKVKVDKQLV